MENFKAIEEIRTLKERLAHEINKRKEAEEKYNQLLTESLELQKQITSENKEKLLKIIDSRKEIICIIGADGIIKYVSPSCKNLSGYNPEDILGTNHKIYTHEKDFPVLENVLNGLSEENHPTYTYRFRKKDGDFIWKESTFQGVFDHKTKELKEIIAISRDVTDRILMEKRLKESEKRFRLMIEKSPSGVLVFKKGKFVYVNKAAMEMINAKSTEDVIGKGIYEFISPKEIETFKETIKDIYKGRKVTFNESKWTRVDGSEFDVDIVGYPILFQDQTAYQLVVRDITEKNEMRKMAIISEKLNTIGELAAGMAHEIRNPLTSINGFLQLIRKGNYNEKYYDIMESELERIEMIVSQLLLSSKPQETDFLSTNIQGLVAEVISFLKPECLLHNVSIKNKVTYKGLALIDCNPFQIKQVLINIIKNAMEAMPNGGKITLSIALKGEDHFSIKIADQGIGIPKDKLSVIGQPFYTTKKNGTGLGMMVSYSIIQNHHGRINIESEEGIGTTFEIILPIKQRD